MDSIQFYQGPQVSKRGKSKSRPHELQSVVMLPCDADSSVDENDRIEQFDDQVNKESFMERLEVKSNLRSDQQEIDTSRKSLTTPSGHSLTNQTLKSTLSKMVTVAHLRVLNPPSQRHGCPQELLLLVNVPLECRQAALTRKRNFPVGLCRHHRCWSTTT